MTFRNKILLSIWGVVLSLLVITFFIIDYWIHSTIETSSSRELRTEFSAVAVREELQTAHLIRACAIIAESPRLRAVAELGDVRTASQLLQELNHTTLSQILVLTDRRGRPIVQLLEGARDRWDLSGSRSIRDALGSTPSADVWSLKGKVYRVVSVPILIGSDLVGTLSLGFEITRADIYTIKRATSSELVLLDHGAIVASTLDSAEELSVLPALAVAQDHADGLSGDSLVTPLSFSTSGETYLGAAFRLSHGAEHDAGGVFYFILKPLHREVRQALASILGTIGTVSLAFLVLTTVIGLVISRSITRPISDLVKGTTEITRGNYDYALRIRGRDELTTLALRFTEMSSSLKEKITQLGRLNQDLLDRNRDLDDTLRKLRSAQEELVRSERLAATGKMTAQLAHEINNPIHNIQSCLKTALARLPLDAKGRDLIAVAYDEIGRLSRLTVQMLDFYRNSLVEEIVRPTSPGELLREIVTVTQSSLHGEGIAVEVDIDERLPLVQASRDKLKQVLLNLVSNARDAMPGGGRLVLSARGNGKTVRIAVKDQGTGIPKEHLGRIFDAFFTTKGKVSGVGLGLAVSYGIVKQHGGTIEVESEVGRGTTFTIVLPAETKP